VSPGVDSTTLSSGLFVLAALFVRTAVTTLTGVESALTRAILAAFLIAASSASRTVVLRITSRRLLRSPIMTFVLSRILFVCHIHSPLGLVN
jgi:hypothetical protein